MSSSPLGNDGDASSDRDNQLVFHTKESGEIELSIVGLILCTLWVMFLIRQYARPSTPLMYIAQVYISWWLSFAGTLVLLPLDLTASSSLYHQCGEDFFNWNFKNDENNNSSFSSNITDSSSHQQQQLPQQYLCHKAEANETVLIDISPVYPSPMMMWKLIYWITFVWSWIVCPVVMEYAVAGEFTRAERLRSALSKNGKRYLIGCFIIIFIAIWISLSQRMSIDQVEGVLIAAANVYGMTLIVVMIGYGLVEVPRFLWRSADPRRQLSYLEFQASSVEGSMLDAMDELQEIVGDVIEFQNQISPDDVVMIEHVKTVLSKVPPHLHHVHPSLMGNSTTSSSSYALHPSSTHGDSSTRITTEIKGKDMKTLSLLHYTLKKAVIKAERAKDDWDRLLQNANDLELFLEKSHALALGVAPSANPYNSSLDQTPLGNSSFQSGGLSTSAFNADDALGDDLNISANGNGETGFRENQQQPSSLSIVLSKLCRVPVINFLYQFILVRVGPMIFRILAVMTFILSLMLLWNECTIPFGDQLSIYGIALNRLAIDAGPVAVQMMSFFFLSYMCICAYTSLFKFKLLEGLALHPNGQSDVYCLLGNSSYVSRLQFALGFNFFSMLKKTETQVTAFSGLVGDLADAGPILGSSFNKYIPFVIGLFAISTAFNFVDRILRLFHIDTNEHPIRGNVDHEERINEGRRLILNARRTRQRPQQRQRERQRRSQTSQIRPFDDDSTTNGTNNDNGSSQQYQFVPNTTNTDNMLIPMEHLNGSQSP